MSKNAPVMERSGGGVGVETNKQTSKKKKKKKKAQKREGRSASPFRKREIKFHKKHAKEEL